MKENEYLQQLLENYLNRKATEAETSAFISEFGEIENAEELKVLLHRYFRQDEESADEASPEERLATEAVRNNLLKILAEETAAPKRIVRLWYLPAAVAAIFLGIMGAAFLYLHYLPQNKPPGPATFSQSVSAPGMPGTSRAILTLENGQTIELDGKKNGLIARQGTIRIVKTRDGQLLNQPTGTAATAAETHALALASSSASNTITTPRGGTYQVTLPDGTSVWLNAASSLTYPVTFTQTERMVELTGEAYFEVAKNKNKPFIVSSRGMTVRVLGTHFNINSYSDEKALVTTLLEGSIRLGYKTSGVILTPGEQASIQAVTGEQTNGEKITGNQASASQILITQPSAPEGAIAWKEGYFQFDHAAISLVMRQLARWYNVSFSLQGKPTSRLFGGSIQRNLTLNQVLTILTRSGIHYKIEGREVIIMP